MTTTEWERFHQEIFAMLQRFWWENKEIVMSTSVHEKHCLAIAENYIYKVKSQGMFKKSYKIHVLSDGSK